MTNVLTLPLDLSGEAAGRLRGQLERDLAAGLDPGPRQAQIACLSDSLVRSLHQLKEALGRAVSELPADDPAASSLREAAAGMTLIAQAVMVCAGSYRVPSAVTG